MAETPDRLRQIFERIRNDTEQALSLLTDSQEQRALGWKCTGCGYIKHFTKPVSLDVVARCPRCKSEQFVPLLYKDNRDVGHYPTRAKRIKSCRAGCLFATLGATLKARPPKMGRIIVTGDLFVAGHFTTHSPEGRSFHTQHPIRKGITMKRITIMKSDYVTFAVIALAWFVLVPAVQAVLPPPDGGYPPNNTAEGDGALFSNTTGAGNVAIGFQTLFNNNTGSVNTATGTSALFLNTDGSNNTANGFEALFSNTHGSSNAASGASALFNNTTGSGNTADGPFSLYSNTTGSNNTATGSSALYHNTTSDNNTAMGQNALLNNATGGGDTAVGNGALFHNTTGSNNTAVGFAAGSALDGGSNNIEIGNLNPSMGTSTDVAGESNTIRIGALGVQTATFVAGINGVDKSSGSPVFIDANGQLGTGATGSGLATGDLLFRISPSTTPAGFTKIGTTQQNIKDLSGHPLNITLDVYQKN